MHWFFFVYNSSLSYYFGSTMERDKQIKDNKNIYALFKETALYQGYIDRSQKGLFIIILFSFLFSACVSQRVMKTVANDIAKESNLQPIFIRTSTFSLQGYYRFHNAGPLTVYIEGDGLAYLHRNTPSANPTPRNPLALRLAGIDRGENVFYLARPCQYVNFKSERLCKTSYWTHKRFSKEVILAVNEAIDKMVPKGKVDGIHLVGYSGGGAVAALVAASRRDVLSLRTLAGYMDHVILNRKKDVSPLKGSLDPIKAAPRLKSVPQIHYSGIKDKVIPKWVAKKFAHAVGNKNCASVRLINATHARGWEKAWKKVWFNVPVCR